MESVVKLLTSAMQERLREHVNEVVSTKAFKAGVASTTVIHGHYQGGQPSILDVVRKGRDVGVDM